MFKQCMTGCLILFVMQSMSYASFLPKAQPVPGGIAHVELAIGNGHEPRVKFYDRPVMVKKVKDHWIAIVGIPLYVKPGKHRVQVVSPTRQEYDFVVKPKRYRTQRLRIDDESKVHLSEKDLARVERETKQIEKIARTFSKSRELPEPLGAPVKGTITSRFGSRRYYNGKKGEPHRGIDIAARAGTSVRAPTDGIVLATGDYFFMGKTIFIDHGHGLITVYAHLNKINVARGRHVVRGQVIGKVGSSGRATGPHLHWAVLLNGARVDPTLLMRSGRTLRD